jgi:hypothetical protein
MCLYTSAAFCQNMQVKVVRQIPTQVLPSCKMAKSPPWAEWKSWGGELTPGWFHSDDLCSARERLFALGSSRV